MTELELTVEQFDPSSHTAMQAAATAARSLGHGFIGTEHLLLGAAEADETVSAALARHFDFPDAYKQKLLELLRRHPEWRRHVPRREALAAVGVDLDAVQQQAASDFGADAQVQDDHGPPFTPRAADALRAAATAARAHDRQASAADIAVAALGDHDGYAAVTARELGADPAVVAGSIEVAAPGPHEH